MNIIGILKMPARHWFHKDRNFSVFLIQMGLSFIIIIPAVENEEHIPPKFTFIYTQKYILKQLFFTKDENGLQK